MVGRRYYATTDRFMLALWKRNATGHRFQLSTDGFGAYVYATEAAFGPRADYAEVEKQYRDARRSRATCPA